MLTVEQGARVARALMALLGGCIKSTEHGAGPV